jgi:hypothetical protein
VVPIGDGGDRFPWRENDPSIFAVSYTFRRFAFSHFLPGKMAFSGAEEVAT